jgi:N-acetylglutamate synthase
MSYTFQPLRMEDFDTIVALWKITPGVGLSSADRPEAIAVFLERNPATCFSAWDGERLAGTVLAGHDGRRGYLYHVAVAEQDRRKGLGSELVRRSLDVLQACGIQKCHIFVYAHNEAGLAFWRQTGWVQRNELVILSHDIP